MGGTNAKMARRRAWTSGYTSNYPYSTGFGGAGMGPYGGSVIASDRYTANALDAADGVLDGRYFGQPIYKSRHLSLGGGYGYGSGIYAPTYTLPTYISYVGYTAPAYPLLTAPTMPVVYPATIGSTYVAPTYIA